MVVRCFTEYWKKGDVAVVDELGVNDLVFYYPHARRAARPRTGQENAHRIPEAFPDLSFDVAGNLIAGGGLCGRALGRRRHAYGPAFSDLPVGALPAASGKKIYFLGTKVYRIKKGKIAEELGRDEALTARQQLGRAPLSNIGQHASTIRVAGRGAYPIPHVFLPLLSSHCQIT
jgi:predicted ester cyclase